MFKNLPNANELAEKVTRGIYEKAEKQAAKIESLIKTCADSGKRECCISDDLEKATIAELRRLGYIVKTFYDQRDGNYTTINW